MGAAVPPSSASEWLLLIHQLPPTPAYLRVKVGRRLAKVGSVAVKNSVYVLPHTEAALEDFQWIVREIADDGGEASISAARFLAGLDDEAVRALFREARDDDYAELAEAARALAGGPSGPEPRDLARLQRRLDEVIAMDFFDAAGRGEAETALIALRGKLDGKGSSDAARDKRAASYRGRTWVTRQGVKVDRIASAWLIREHIDPDARFRFVAPQGYVPAEGELRFDMFEAEFTHQGDRCTFEVLLDLVDGVDAALAAIGEIVHDIDLKDAKYARPEAPGVARLIDGICRAEGDDLQRIARGSQLLADLRGALAGEPPQA